MASRVSLSHTLTISGGKWRDPSRSRGAGSCRRSPPRPWRRQARAPRRNAVMKALNARASSAGSSSRNSRLKVSWLGAPCGRATISRKALSSRPSAKSAISTQLFAPHSVAAKVKNRIVRNSVPRIDVARIANFSQDRDNTTASGLLRKEKAPTESLKHQSARHYSTHMRFPCACGGGSRPNPWLYR